MGEPTTYAQLIKGHECSVEPTHKKAFFTVMEDGKICLIVAEQAPDTENPTAWGILEWLPMHRADFNAWMHASRGWWNDEKAHPTVPQIPGVS